MAENAKEDVGRECLNELGFDIEVEGPEEEQYKIALIWWAKLEKLVDWAEEIIIYNPLNRSIPTKFREIYKDFFLSVIKSKWGYCRIDSI